MSTHPEVVTLDPHDADDVTRVENALADTADIPWTDDRAVKFLRALAAPPLPKEPPEWTVVRAGDVVLVRQAPTARRASKYRWWRVGTEEVGRTWPEVCALGTPEVLEPDSVKALREQVNRYDAWLERVGDALAEARGVRVHWSDLDTSVKALVDRAEKAEREVEEFIAIDIDRSATTEDEPAEPAPVEVTTQRDEYVVAVMSADLCGYTVVDHDGIEGPCDLPATGWRWYQDVEHEDTLDAACDLHSNEGGRRIKALEEVRDAANGRVKGLKEFDHTIHPSVALQDVRNVLERRMGADWLNGRGDSE
jgi:hypothetical protein